MTIGKHRHREQVKETPRDDLMLELLPRGVLPAEAGVLPLEYVHMLRSCSSPAAEVVVQAALVPLAPNSGSIPPTPAADVDLSPPHCVT